MADAGFEFGQFQGDRHWVKRHSVKEEHGQGQEGNQCGHTLGNGTKGPSVAKTGHNHVRDNLP